MSLVRMFTVTVSLFRMCMCVCLRARERERREASTKASDAELLRASQDGFIEQVKLEVRITAENFQVSDEPFRILNGLNLPAFVQTDELKRIVGPYSPRKQHLADCEEPVQDKSSKRHLRTGLQWLSNSIGEHGEELVGQEEPQVMVPEAEEVGRPLIYSPVPAHTIAWSDSESCVNIGSPTCIPYQHHQAADGKASVEIDLVDGKNKTLVDELLETDKVTYTCGACVSDSRGSCQCGQLPNQILGTQTSACTIKLLMVGDLKEELTNGEAGELVRSTPRGRQRITTLHIDLKSEDNPYY